MKRLVVGLALFGFLIFSSRPLFSGPDNTSNPTFSPQAEKPALINPITPEERDYIKDLYKPMEDVGKPDPDPFIPPKLLNAEPEPPSPPSSAPPGDRDGPGKRNDFFGDQNQIPPSRQVVEDLLEFVDREKESILKIDLEDVEFRFSDSEFADMAQIELQLMKLIDVALSAIEQGEVSALDVIVLDAVVFNAQIRAIHQLLNPPARLDPLLKWLLYLNRVTPEMMDLYQAALQKRDRIYLLAARSNGKLKIRYNGKVLDDAVYVWPDQEARYELVIVSPASSGQPLS